MKTKLAFFIVCFIVSTIYIKANNPCLKGGNPIVANIGLADGHFKVYGGRIYDYASHDYYFDSKDFVLKKWWIWSTTDLVTWTFEASVSPTILGFPANYKNCWATDSQTKNGKYYFYVCNPESTYVLRSDTPVGPWEAPLGKNPLMSGRDPSVFIDNDQKAYLVTGVWNYQIAELNDDMISLKEKPRYLSILNPRGPYNYNGKNSELPTDDKPDLHKHNGKYYLSWGCYYAISDNVYGPYEYKGCFIVPERTEKEFSQPKAGLTQDRHGSFFEWNNQTYFNCNDLSSNGANTFWRNTVIMYIHYKDNGEIAPAYITRTGVGQYDASSEIQAENFYSSSNAVKHQIADNEFGVRMFNESSLSFQNVYNIPANALAILRVATNNGGSVIEIWSDDNAPELLGACKLPKTGNKYTDVRCKLKNVAGKHTIRLVYKGIENTTASIDWFRFK